MFLAGGGGVYPVPSNSHKEKHAFTTPRMEIFTPPFGLLQHACPASLFCSFVMSEEALEIWTKVDGKQAPEDPTVHIFNFSDMISAHLLTDSHTLLSVNRASGSLYHSTYPCVA